MVAIGMVLGGSLGPALFLAIERLELSGDLLLSFLIGAFVTLGVGLTLAGVSALLFVPRFFANAKGTLVSIVQELTNASAAHARGEVEVAVRHFGSAVNDGVAWYSMGTTRRTIMQAAIGLLIAFGGLVGAVLLFSQNALLRKQNDMISSQLGLLKDQNDMIDRQLNLLREQNDKIDTQLRLLVAQNQKIDQQTMVADAQKRSAFATELFAILKEVAERVEPQTPELSRSLLTRISVLTTSAAPYIYIDFTQDGPANELPQAPVRISRPLSPERGQLLVALARMKIDLALVQRAGAVFESADLRKANLYGANLSRLVLDDSDFSGASLQTADLSDCDLENVRLEKVQARESTWSRARISGTMDGGDLTDANLDDAIISDAAVTNSNFGGVKFNGTRIQNVTFKDVIVARYGAAFPSGLGERQAFDQVTADNDKTLRLTHFFTSDWK